MAMVQHVLLTLSLLGLALLLGATAYESVVMAPNYERDIPDSIDVARRFLQRTTPAHYFRVLTPVTQLALLGSVVLTWRSPAVRTPSLIGLGVLVLLDIITFTFHYPRLAIMFKGSMPDDVQRLRRAAREWAVGNILRVLLLVIAVLAILHAILAQYGSAA